MPGDGIQKVQFTRRHLPHWQVAHATYFLTWRCWTGNQLSAPDRDIALEAILHWQAVRWDVFAAVVMPDHVHVLARSLAKADGVWALEELVHSVKSYSAHLINRLRRRSGRVWQDERFDRWLRDESEFEQKWEYIAHNPLKAGLIGAGEAYNLRFARDSGRFQVRLHDSGGFG